jgi:hypothetical protein
MEIEALVEGSALSRIGTMPPPASQKPPQLTSTTNSLPSSDSQAPSTDPQTPPTDGLAPSHTGPQWPDALTAYAARESRRARYVGNRVGGTVVVHYIKRNEWFLEAALALLGGEDEVKDRLPGSK